MRIEMLEQALAKDPADQATQEELARAYMQAGRHGDAQDLLARLLAENPACPWIIQAMLSACRQSGDTRLFLQRYRQLRPFLGLDQGLEFDSIVDEQIACLARDEDLGLRKEAALLMLQRGQPQCLDILMDLGEQGRLDRESAGALADALFWHRPESLDPRAFARALSPREHGELVACLDGKPGPALFDHLDKLICPSCRQPGLEPGGPGLLCPACGRQITLDQGVPLLFAGPDERYQHIEPEFRQSFAQPHVLRTFARLAPQIRYSNSPYPEKDQFPPRQLLKMEFSHLPSWLKILRFVARSLPRDRPALVLDLGSAKGNDALALARIFPGHCFWGLELVPAGAKVGQRFRGRQANQFICGNAAELIPLADDSLDLLISRNAIEHGGVQMGKEIRRVLKPGARAMVIGPSYKSYVFATIEAMEYYMKVHVIPGSKLENHGLKEEEYARAFEGLTLVEHSSVPFFPRLFLEAEIIDRMPAPKARELFREMCDVLGQALDSHPQGRWYNYLQVFELQKTAGAPESAG